MYGYHPVFSFGLQRFAPFKNTGSRVVSLHHSPIINTNAEHGLANQTVNAYKLSRQKPVRLEQPDGLHFLRRQTFAATITL